MFRITVLAICLVTALMPAMAMAHQESAALPAWLQAQLDARGIEVDAADVHVIRTVTNGEETRSFEVPLSALLQDDPFAGHDVAGPSVPEVLAGQLTLHLMLQFSCDGYGAQGVGAGISAIRGASWDVGLHLALGPLAGGVAASTGGDPVTNLLIMANTDTGMTAAAGQMSITEDRIEIFGICLLLIGQSSGTGVWAFE